MKLLFATAAISLFAITAAAASSPDAWKQFRDDVEKKCLAAAPGDIESPTAWVHDTGTKSYGIAIVSGRSRSAGARQFFVCVYNKRTHAVETTPPNDLQPLMRDCNC